MANTLSAARFFRRAKVREWPAQPDFADHGTAFGLDLAMTPEISPAPESRGTAARDIGFWRRLADRRNPHRG